jgi:hypothetical protein
MLSRRRSTRVSSYSLIIIDLQVLSDVGYFHEMLIKHIDLIERRLVNQETIAHEEKVFSLFEGNCSGRLLKNLAWHQRISRNG